MSAEDVLQNIGDKYDLHWDDWTMVTVACRYIDAQCSENAFIDFVEETARSELDIDE